MSPALTIEPAHPNELSAAFGLVFQYLPEDDGAGRVANALRLLREGELDPEGVLVARRAGQLCGALVCLPVPGASALVWPPQALPGPLQTDIEDQLVLTATTWLRQRGARVGQCLLAPHETDLAAPLLRQGFTHITALSYLRHDLDLPDSYLLAEDRLEYQVYQPANTDLFHQTLLRTYEGTLDCPEVNGVRSVEQIIEGHRAQGRHDPARWWLACADGQPVGVLLLTWMQDWQAWDVAYVGVVPEQRRRGWGRELMHKALCSAHATSAVQVTLSVDARNQPAWDLYVGLGFEPYDRREVYLALWL
jgi:ribosomal protein S18 acetylase RimI-like enzyme